MTKAKEYDQTQRGDTWPRVLAYNYQRYGAKRRAMRHKQLGIWKPYTWKDYYLNVKYLALGFLSLGFKAGDKVLIIGDNAPEWYFAELAAQANQGISVGVFSDLTSSEIHYLATNSEASFAVVQDQEQVDKLLQIVGRLPLLKKIIYWNYKGLAHADDQHLMGYREVLQLGEDFEKEHRGIFEQNIKKGKADDVCAIVYTSGATGAAPKGAMHSYRTMRTGAEYLLQLDRWRERDTIVPYLPPAWMTEQWLGIGCHLLSACIQNFAESPETQQRDTREIEPTIMCHGGRQWSSQAAMVHARMLGADIVKRLAFRILMPVGYKMADARFAKQEPGLWWRFLNATAAFILLRPIKKSLGLAHARICYSTGETLSPEVFRFYHALGIPLKSLYGTTEGGILACAANDDICLDTIGPVISPSIEVKIAETGELRYRQPGTFVGYYKDEAQTAEVLKNGWFCSGDSCVMRDDGSLAFVDRMQDLVTLRSGVTLSPQMIESRLKFSPFIKDAWVLAGPKKLYPAAVIVINDLAVGRWAGQQGVAYATFAELSQQAEVYALIKEEIERINSALPTKSRVQKYVILHKEFDPDDGEVTRSRKLRRHVLTEHYRALINAIYANKTTVPIQAHVTYRDGREGTIKTLLHIKSVTKAVPLVRPAKKSPKKSRVKKRLQRPKSVKKPTKQRGTKVSKKSPKKYRRRRTV
jgi:long-chain acyl-CoA synthetase